MFYPSTAGSVVSFAAPASRGYYPAAPMSAVLPGQHYYPTMHAAPAYPMSAAPVMMQQPAYGYGHAMPAYYGQPTVIAFRRSGKKVKLSAKPSGVSYRRRWALVDASHGQFPRLQILPDPPTIHGGAAEHLESERD
ncbi:unnamed protein product [Cyclocybe aegerita]|uniref:Uncharacterized protein n=1 Tax=Cyclocybe aegerita TaxID=1973307 RepID=A0A8S0W693_CYCAE|nr:unnamed protein product [Cyclocybe aegerita]